MKIFNILVTGEKLHNEAIKVLQKKSRLFFTQDYPSKKEIIDLIKMNNIEVLIVRMGKIDKEIIDVSPMLKVIIKHGVGVNNIDIKCAKTKNIPVLITSQANYKSVAEHTLGLILCVLKKISYLDTRIKIYKKWDKPNTKTTELANKNIGLIGLGRIGLELTKYLEPFETKIFFYDPYQNNIFNNIKKIESLGKILNISDIISIHCPLNKETYHLFGENEFRLMKNNAILINTARGSIINRIDLYDALKKEKIAGAGLDCLENEPPYEDDPLLNLPNVVITPHIAGSSLEGYIRMGMSSAKMAIDFMDGGIDRIDKNSIAN